MTTHSRFSQVLRLPIHRLLSLAFGCLGFAPSAGSAGVEPINWPATADYPDWWYQRDAIVPRSGVAGTPVWPVDFDSNNFAPVTAQQLKAFTKAASDEINFRISSASGAAELTAFVATWPLDVGPHNPLNNQALNMGQLKVVAAQVYQPLVAAGYFDQVPWAFLPGKGNDRVPANIGQLKNLFRFDLSVAVPGNRNRLAALTRTNWSGTGSSLSGYTPAPVSETQIGSGLSNNAFESISSAENYGERLCGYLTITQADDYRFYVAATGAAEFYLSNDHDPSNLILRAKSTAPVPSARDWTHANAGKSHLLSLKPGRYYVELRHKVGTGVGLKYVSVGWAKYSDTTTPASTWISVIPSSVLSRRTSPLPIFTPPEPNHVPWHDPDNSAVADRHSDRNAATRFLIQATFGPSGWNEDAEYGDNSGTTAGSHGTACDECNADFRGACTKGPERGGDCPYRHLVNGQLVHPLFHDSHCGGLCAVPNCNVRYQFPSTTVYHPLVHNRIHGPACGGWKVWNTSTTPPTKPTLTPPGSIPYDVSQVQLRGFDGWITDQIAIPRSKLHPYVQARHNAGPFGNNYHPGIFYAAWWRNAITARDQLRQRMAFALSEIMVVSVASIGSADAVSSYYDEVLSANAFGNFRDILQGVTLHPAMGQYLNMLKNKKTSILDPNENYARELMQLFSMGMNRMHPDGTLMLDAEGRVIQTYSQNDVRGLAHVFTGWDFDFTPDYASWRAQGNDAWPWYRTTVKDVQEMIRPMKPWLPHHDNGRKEVLNHVVLPAFTTPPHVRHPTQDANNLPDDELKIVLDEIFNHPNCGPFICRQLIQRFVTSHPSSAYLHRVVSKFNDDGTGVRGNMEAVIRAILMDYEARSSTVGNTATFGKQREPLLRMTAIARAFPSNEFDYTGAVDHDADWTTAPQPRSGLKWMSSWEMGQTSFTSYSWQLNLNQTPLAAPSVFNFFRPDYKFPGILSDAGLTTPEFQLTTDTSVIDQANAIYSSLYNWAGAVQPGLRGIYTGNRFLCVNFKPWEDYANSNSVAQMVGELNKRLLAGQLPSSGTNTYYPAGSRSVQNAEDAIEELTLPMEIHSISPATTPGTVNAPATPITIETKQPHGLTNGEKITFRASMGGNFTFLDGTVPYNDQPNNYWELRDGGPLIFGYPRRPHTVTVTGAKTFTIPIARIADTTPPLAAEYKLISRLAYDSPQDRFYHALNLIVNSPDFIIQR